MSVDSRRLLAVVAGGVLIAAIGGAQRVIPETDDMYAPIASTGTVKEEVRVEPYGLRVDSVKVALRLRVKPTFGDAEPKTTQGVWVVVHATATATREQVGLGDVGLRSRSGRFYSASDRVDGLHDADLEAGIPRSGPIAFEIPRDELPGSVLSISGAEYAQAWRHVGALGPAIEIDLGLDRVRPAGVLTVDEAEL